MRISLPTHALVELLGGLALLAAPFVLGFAAAGTVVAVAGGVLLVGLAGIALLALACVQLTLTTFTRWTRV